MRGRAADDAEDRDRAVDGPASQPQVPLADLVQGVPAIQPQVTRDDPGLADAATPKVPRADLVQGDPAAQPKVGHNQHLVMLQCCEVVNESEKKQKACSKCCCLEHCRVRNHNTQHWKKAIERYNPFAMSTVMNIESEYLESNNEDDIYFSQETNIDDGLTSILMRTDLKL